MTSPLTLLILLSWNFSLFSWSIFLCVNSSYHLVSFIFIRKYCLYYFLLDKSAINEFSQFLFTWECLKFFLISKDGFAEYRSLGWQFSFLSAFWVYHPIVFYSPLFLMTSGAMLIGNPLYITNHSFLDVFKVISLFLAFHNLTMICLCINFLSLSYSESLSYLEIQINFFH